MSVTTNPPRVPMSSATGPLRPSLPAWGLLGRLLLVWIGEILIVPLPWTAAAFYRFACAHIALPDGKRLKFTGKGGDIWYVFMGTILVIWVAAFVGVFLIVASDDQDNPVAYVIKFAGLLASWALAVLILRWFCGHATTEDGRLSLTFDGGIWTYIGWNVLLSLSIVTIIGWAWVLKFMVRWICRNVGGNLAFDFTAPGLAILWRSLLTWLLCVLIIPIPWMLRWYINWFISQIEVVPPGANA